MEESMKSKDDNIFDDLELNLDKPITEDYESQEEMMVVPEEEVTKAVESVAITITDEIKEKYQKKPRKKKDMPTSKELDQMSNEEIEDTISDGPDDVKKLYNEFTAFLADTTGIKEDTGTKVTIPTGIDYLDVILGGGFSVGNYNLIIGDPGSGKSMLVAQTIGNAQRLYPGIMTPYLDSEQSMTTIRLAGLGANNPKIKPFTDMSVENIFQILEAMCLFKSLHGVEMPSLMVWDSLANTLTDKEKEAADPNTLVGYRGRVMSLLIPQAASKLSKHNICMIVINQFRDEINMNQYQKKPKDLYFMRTGKNIPGGNAIKFNAFHLLDLKMSGKIDEEKEGFRGFMCEMKCIKNKLFSPYVPAIVVGDFVNGFSNFWTNYKFLISVGRLKPGAWNYLVEYPTVKFRTSDAPEKYKSDPEFKKMFDAALKEAFQKELIEKNTPDII